MAMQLTPAHKDQIVTLKAALSLFKIWWNAPAGSELETETLDAAGEALLKSLELEDEISEGKK